MVFELLCGDYLFDSKQEPSLSKEQNHIAIITELIHNWPTKFALSGIKSKKYFKKNGELKDI